MNIEDATGPGVDPRLMKRLQSWGINTLTDVQVRALNAGIANGCSMIVSAPTSTGKGQEGRILNLNYSVSTVGKIGTGKNSLFFEGRPFMNVVYEPRGRAREYSELACNLYRGCTHGCRYCYAPACIRQVGRS